MSSIQSLPPSAFALGSLPTSRIAETRAGDSGAAAWLDAGARATQGGPQVLHVSAHDPRLGIDRIEQDFIAALCGEVNAAR